MPRAPAGSVQRTAPERSSGNRTPPILSAGYPNHHLSLRGGRLPRLSLRGGRPSSRRGDPLGRPFPSRHREAGALPAPVIARRVYFPTKQSPRPSENSSSPPHTRRKRRGAARHARSTTASLSCGLGLV